MLLTKLSETSTTITFGWIPPVGVQWYLFYAGGARVSNSPPENKQGVVKNTITFGKGSNQYQVVALTLKEGLYDVDVGTWDINPVPVPSGNRLTRPILNTPETIIITNTNRNAAQNLSSGKDYVLDVRAGIDGLIPIKGGRNINVICSGDFAFTNTRTSAFWDHTGISVYDGDPDSTVHIEGARLLGPTLHDGIVWNAPGRNIRLQTTLIKVTNWAYINLGSGNHPDGVQSQGSVKSVEIDLLTVYTPLQGTFFGDHAGVIGPTNITRMNVVGLPGSNLFWKSNPDAAPVTLADTYLDNPGSTLTSIGRWVFPNELGEVVYTQYRTATARVSADGSFVDFPGTCISGGFKKGRPSTGDFVK